MVDELNHTQVIDENSRLVQLFCKSIIKYRHSPGYDYINGKHLNALKTKTFKDGQLNCLMTYVDSGNLDKEDLVNFCMKMYEKLVPDDFNEDVLVLLRDLIDLGLDSTIMGINLEQDDITRFLLVYERYISQFNAPVQTKLRNMVNFKLIDGNSNRPSCVPVRKLVSNEPNNEERIAKLVTDTVKQLFNDKITSNNTLLNSQTPVVVLDSDNNDVKFNERLIGFNNDKILMARHHINIMNLHLENKTTPASLFFNRFPFPFYSHDEEFVQKYNNRIEEFQRDVMNDIIAHSLNKIKQHEDVISNHIDLITNKTENYSEIVSKNLKEKELKMKDFIVRKMNKARQCVAKPFIKMINKNKHSSQDSLNAPFNNSSPFSNTNISAFNKESTPNNSRRTVRFHNRDHIQNNVNNSYYKYNNNDHQNSNSQFRRNNRSHHENNGNRRQFNSTNNSSYNGNVFVNTRLNKNFNNRWRNNSNRYTGGRYLNYNANNIPSDDNFNFRNV